jgi:hypothetical protein
MDYVISILSGGENRTAALEQLTLTRQEKNALLND